MKYWAAVFVVFPLFCFAATVNIDYYVGNPQRMGFVFLSEIRFWEVDARLCFDLTIKLEDSAMVPALVDKPQESLRDLSIVLDSSGIKYGVTEPFLLSFMNVSFRNNSLSVWAFNRTIGGYASEIYLLFLRLNYFSLSVGSDGSYQLGMPIKISDFFIGPLVSNLGYGLSFGFGNLNFTAVLERGFRFSLGTEGFVLYSQYLDGELDVGISWIGRQEWFILTSDGFSFRKRFGEIALVFGCEREEWYAGFSFPVFW